MTTDEREGTTMQGQQIRESLHAGRRVYGTHVCSLTNPVTAGMQASLPYDFVFICNEHMPIDRSETGMMCQFYSARGISPIVRVPAPEPWLVATALDGGAEGIVVPYVETVEQVRQAVGAVKYRPIKGKLLDDFLAGRREPAQKTRDFLDRFNREHYLIIGIESVAAYEDLDRLISVPGVDGVFVGPHDLTVSMEIPEEFEHPDFVRVVDDIVMRCRDAGLGVGVHLSQMVAQDDRFRALLDKGMNWVLYGADIALLVSEMRRRLDGFRSEMKDTYVRGAAENGEPASCLGVADGRSSPGQS